MALSTILLFSLAAAIGLYLVVLGVRFKRSSPITGLIHALIGVLATVLLFTQIVSDTTNKYNNGAALLMILTLTGGIMLFALREKNKPPAMAVVTIHAIMALTGLLVLILGYR